MGGGGSRQWHTHTHLHPHPYSVPRDTQHGWSLENGSDAILTHVGVAHPLIKSMGYGYREDAGVGGGAGSGKYTHTNTHTHTVSLVIHMVDGASGKDRTQS